MEKGEYFEYKKHNWKLFEAVKVKKIIKAKIDRFSQTHLLHTTIVLKYNFFFNYKFFKNN